jgi:hypothetical protein
MNRVIDFSKKNAVLPSDFINVKPKRMIYAAGDAFGGFDKQNNATRRLTNIEAFTKLGFNIFCCGDFVESDENIQYLKNHPELNIVLCILTGDNKVDFSILQTLFKNSLDEINTDDIRFYPDSKTVFEMLKLGGVSLKVHQRFIIGQTKNTKRVMPWMPYDLGWGEPNFKIIEQTARSYNFVKTGLEYLPEPDNDIFRNTQTKNNAAYANRLRLENSVAWNSNRGTRKRGIGGNRIKSHKRRTESTKK